MFPLLHVHYDFIYVLIVNQIILNTFLNFEFLDAPEATNKSGLPKEAENNNILSSTPLPNGKANGLSPSKNL